MNFDPLRTRETYLRDEGAVLRSHLDATYGSGLPMGRVAVFQLLTLFSVSLAGLCDDVVPTLPRVVEWLERAIREDRPQGGNRDRYRFELHQAKALAVWMRDNRSDEGEWDAARRYYQASVWRGNVWPRNLMSPAQLDEYLPLCYQAGRYESGIEAYQGWRGGKAAVLGDTPTPRELAFALCLHEARQQFDTDDLYQAGRKVLRSLLERDWVNERHYFDIVTWLKIVHWHRDPKQTQAEIFRQAYVRRRNRRRAGSPQIQSGRRAYDAPEKAQVRYGRRAYDMPVAV